MSTNATDPVNELGYDIDSYAKKILQRVSTMLESSREILKLHAQNVTNEEIARRRGAQVSAISLVLVRLTPTINLPSDMPVKTKKLVYLRAIEFYENGVPVNPSASRPPVSSPTIVEAVPKPELAKPNPTFPETESPVSVPAVQEVESRALVPAPVFSAPKSQVKVKGRLVEVDINRIRRFVGQPREEFDPKKLDWLTNSIREVGQLQPVLFREIYDDPDIDYEIIDGECRWICSRRAGRTTLDGVEYPGLSVPDAKKQYLISLISNFGRSNHTPLELAHAGKRLMDENSWTATQAAAAMSIDPSTISYHLRLLKLVPEAQALMRITIDETHRLTIAQAVSLVDYPEEFQRQVAAEIVEKKLRGNETPWYIRRRAAELAVVVNRGRRRGRRPAGDARNFQRSLETFEGHLDQYLNLPDVTIAEAIRRRSMTEQVQMSVQLGRLIEKLQGVKDELKEATESDPGKLEAAE